MTHCRRRPADSIVSPPPPPRQPILDLMLLPRNADRTQLAYIFVLPAVANLKKEASDVTLSLILSLSLSLSLCLCLWAQLCCRRAAGVAARGSSGRRARRRCLSLSHSLSLVIRSR